MEKYQGIVSCVSEFIKKKPVTPVVVERPIADRFLTTPSRLQEKWDGYGMKTGLNGDAIQPRMSTWARKRMEEEELKKLTSIYCGACGERYATRFDLNAHMCFHR